MTNNNQQTQTTTKKRAGIRFYLLLGLVILILQIGTDLFQNFLKQAQTSNTTLSEVSKSQNSVKLSEIIARKEDEVVKQLEEKTGQKSEENQNNPELTYRIQMQNILNSLTKSSENISNFITKNPSYTEWTMENKTYVAVQIITMKNNYKKFQQIAPPTDYQEFHNTMIRASKFGGYAADDLVNGIDNHSAFLISSAEEKTKKADENISSANSMLEKILKNKALEIE